MSGESRRIIAGPFNRVEGDLEIRLDIEGGKVTRAEANSPLFRGFERILEGKDPRQCPSCQTGGRILKDRRLSRILR